MKARLHRWATAGALLALVSIVGATPARAAEATKTVKDERGIVSLEVPQHWQVQKPRDQRGTFGLFVGNFPGEPFTEEPNLSIEFRIQLGYAQPALARFMEAGFPGTKLLPDSTRNGDGWSEEARRREDGVVFTRRCWSKDEVVYEAIAIAHESFLEVHAAEQSKILDTVEITGAYPRPLPPPGYEVIETKGIEIWTDDPGHDRVKAVTELMTRTQAMLADVLPGEPAVAAPLRIILCGSDGPFKEYAAVDSQNPLAAFYERDSRAMCVLLDARPPGDAFWKEACWAASRAVVQRHFGGIVPKWMYASTAVYCETGRTAKWKPAKPRKSDKTDARAAIETSGLTFDQLFEMPNFKPFDEVERYSAWAWMMYFVHGKASKDQAAAYRKHLEILRETGDPGLARAAWDDIDRDKLNAGFQKWLKRWK